METLIFFITCTNDHYIKRCIESISSSNNHLKIRCEILLQNGVSIPLKQLETTNTLIDIYNIENIISLSKARNILMSKLEIDESAYYMFPDDDSIFDETFFNNFRSVVRGNTLMAVKATQDKESYFIKMPKRVYAKKTDYHNAISVNMIIKGKTLRQVGEFDENLGVGNYYGAGEDNDYFIRCSTIEPFIYTNDIWNYHPLQKDNFNLPVEKLVERYKYYGRGVMFMLLKHGMVFQAWILIIRGYFGALLYLLKLNTKMSYVYFKAANERLSTFFKRISCF